MTHLFTKLNRSTKLTIGVLISAVLLKFLLHYAEFGFFEFILFDLYFSLILFLLGWAILMGKLFRRRLTLLVLVDFLIIGLTYCIIHFGLNTNTLDNIDWKLNFSKRQKIVRLIKEERFDSFGRQYRIPFSLTLFPYIKSNEVHVVKQKDTIITVEFYTDRGLLDHYTAFVYSNDSLELKRLSESVGGNNKKMAEGWFYMHH